VLILKLGLSVCIDKKKIKIKIKNFKLPHREERSEERQGGKNSALFSCRGGVEWSSNIQKRIKHRAFKYTITHSMTIRTCTVDWYA
jgi:hypothetical protein